MLMNIFFLVCFHFNLSNLNSVQHIIESNFQPAYNSIIKSGKIMKEKGDFYEAINEFKRALNIADEDNMIDGQLYCLMNLGVLYWNVGRIEDSLRFYKKAVILAEKENLTEIYKKCKDAIELCSLYKKGKDLRFQGEYQQSIINFKKAIEIARESNSREHELKCLRQLSFSFEDLNNLNEFFTLNQEALRIALDINHMEEKGKCIINIGNFHKKVGDYYEALNCYYQALRIKRDLNNKQDESICLNNIGIIYQDLGDHDKALDYFRRALEIDHNLGDGINILMDLNNIGTVCRKKGIISNHPKDFYKSLFYFSKCLNFQKKFSDRKERKNVFEMIEVQVLNNIGVVLIDLGYLDKAKQYLLSGYNKSLEMKNLEFNGMCSVNLGFISLNQDDYDGAIQMFQYAIKIAKEIMNAQILWEAYFGLGQCYERKNFWDQAIRFYKKAIDEIDLIRSRILLDSYKIGFSRDKLKVYEFLINLLYRINLDNSTKEFEKEIFYIVEKAKARAFLENLAQSKIDLGTKLNPGLRKSENDISKRMSSLIIKISELDLSESRKKELLIELEREEDKYNSLFFKIKKELSEINNIVSVEPCRVEDIQDLLTRKEVLLEYYLGESHSIMFLITKGEFCVFSLPARAKLEKSIKAYIKILSNPTKDKFAGDLAAKRIYKELLIPVEDYLKRPIENLIIIPDGILYYLPFETLIANNQDQSKGSYYLIERFKISYAPSSSILSLILNKQSNLEFSRGLLAFGNPSSNFLDSKEKLNHNGYFETFKELYLSSGFVFSPLPYSGKEIFKISKYFPHKQRDLFLKNNAKEDVLNEIIRSNYKIIHFACHALLDEKFPFRSALILSSDKDSKEDGFLQVREIYNLNLKAELVVLSACQTGRGKLEKGEGILGFPRIFFFLGARSVLLSLWNINDESTSYFMNYFYYYLSKRYNKAEALQLAKLRMLKSKYRHPFYWAAFILNGDFDSSIILN